MNEVRRGNRFRFSFGAVIAKGTSKPTALFPFFRVDLVERLVFRRNKIRMLDAKSVVNHSIGNRIVILRHDFQRMSGLRIVDIVPQQRRPVALNQLPHMRIRVFPICFTLRFHGLVIRCDADWSRHKRPIVSTRIIESHPQTLSAHGSRKLPNNVARRVLSIGRQRRVLRCARPQGKSVMVLRRQHHIFRSSRAKHLRPRVRIPFLNFTVKYRRKIVVVVIGSVMFAVVFLGRRTFQPHRIQIPFRIGIARNVVLRTEIMLRMNQWRPARNGIQAPVNKNPQLRVRIPLWERVLIERFDRRFILLRLLRKR